MKTITARNPNHPYNIMHTVGQTAKNDVRKLSNTQLDEWIKTNMAELNDLEDALTWPRHRKIKLIKDCAMVGYVNEYEKAKGIVTCELCGYKWDVNKNESPRPQGGVSKTLKQF